MITLRHLERNRSRHGQMRFFYRRKVGGVWRRVRIREVEGSSAFLAHYLDIDRAFAAGSPPDMPDRHADPAPGRDAPGTLGHLALAWMASAMFRDYDPATQTARRYKIDAMLAEPVTPDQPTPTFRTFPLARLTTDHLAILRDRKRTMHGAANERVKILRKMFEWARAATPPLAPHNPAIGLARVATPRRGHHAWSEHEVAIYEARWPVGTEARLALDLILYTGARRSDAVRLGRPHVQGDVLVWTAHKGRRRAPVRLVVPILPPLRASLDAAGGRGLTFIARRDGRPRSDKAFGVWFKRFCREAGLPHCSAHGLRKAGSTRAAEAGATAHQLMAIFGWRTIAQAELYTRSADAKRLAASGMRLLLRPETATPADTGQRGVAKRLKI